ncbi:MAG TPA: MMPL family transporter [Chloroflexota bacterium]|nr:MMPL family transporter [Chloroflexota bacterium]
MLSALGRRMYRLRWSVVAVWMLVLGVAGVFAPRVSGVLHGGGYTIGKSQSVAAYNVLNAAYGYQALTFTIVFTTPDARRAALLRDAQAFRREASTRFGRTLRIEGPTVTPDGTTAFERVYSSPQADFGASFTGPLDALLPHGAVRGYITGPAAIFHGMEVVSDQDLRRVELVTLPLALAVLLLIFGSVVASGVPVLMAPVSVTVALAIIYAIGQRMDMSIFVLNTTSMLGLGVAIDYSLFMVNRFREELALGRELETAVGNTVATSGRAILVSALVVSVGFGGLALSGVGMLRSLGIGGSIVTLLSLLVALSLLPAILGILGPNINLLPVVPRRLSPRRVWHSLSHWVMRHPLPIIATVCAVIAILGIPAFHIRVGIPGPEILPSSVESRAGNDVLNRELGYANQSPVLVVVRRLPGTPVATYEQSAFSVLDRVCSSREVAGVAPAPVVNSPGQIRSCDSALAALQSETPRQRAQARTLAARRSVALISVFLRSNPSSASAERYVAGLRGSQPVPGYEILIGGQTAGQMDFDNYLYSRFPLVILFVIATIYAVLLIAFRSVLLPLKAVLMNVLSVVAAYGVVVFAFQDGNLANLLGFTVVGNIDSIVPVFLFCVLFGISTDYEVFLLTRVQEEYLETGNNEESVARGLEVTGRIITSAAAVMIVVFAAFAFARLVVIKEVGLGLALAVLVDATLIRALLVPATMRLLGRWNWWLPGRGFPTVKRDRVSRGHVPAAE